MTEAGRPRRTGVVYLVGAGPGDPKLLTLRGAEALQRADVVVYDRLASPALLDLAPAGAERVDAGKRRGRHLVRQERINEILIDRARRGLTAVRLKGGDPFVLGRGGEEALACARAGVPFEVVPGVSAAVAAPAYAGIPVTHRGLAASFAVVTASRAGPSEAVRSGGRPVVTPNPPGPSDLARAAIAVDTLVVLMVAARLADVCAELVEAGRPADEPAAVVQWASTARQRTVVATLRDLPARARAAGIGAPATLVVGRVVRLADRLAWFTRVEPPGAAGSGGSGGSA